MPRYYQMQDAEQWGRFSGDNNPIHFNLAAARQWGLNALCIHGMRAMLDIKSSLEAQALLAFAQGPNLRFSCRLEKPVFYQRGYVWEAEQIKRNKRLQLRGRLRDAINQQVCVDAKLLAEPAIILRSKGEDGQISRQEITTAHQQLSNMTGERLSLWSVMDAVLFKQLIHSPATMCRVRDVLPELDCTDLMTVLSQIQMVQTHHETSFSPCLFAADDITVLGDSICFSILSAQVVGKSPDGFILHFSIQAFVDEKVLMKTSVTLKANLSGAK